VWPSGAVHHPFAGDRRYAVRPLNRSASSRRVSARGAGPGAKLMTHLITQQNGFAARVMDGAAAHIMSSGRASCTGAVEQTDPLSSLERAASTGMRCSLYGTRRLVALGASLKLPPHPAQIVVSKRGRVDIDALLFNVPALRVFLIAGDECIARHESAVRARPWIRVIRLDGYDLCVAFERLRVEESI
jgi:hypothetical protein